jgi:hypothetical protein
MAKDRERVSAHTRGDMAGGVVVVTGGWWWCASD